MASRGALGDALCGAVEALLAARWGDATQVVARQPVGGGSINRAERFDLADGRRVFVKSNPAPLPRMFENEISGLASLHQAARRGRAESEIAEAGGEQQLRIPEPLGCGAAPLPFIVLEFIETGRSSRGFSERLGRGLAGLHRRSAERHAQAHQAPAMQAASGPFGFEEDNYIGATPQPNAWTDDWVTFFAEQRLGFQLRLAADNGFGGELARLGERLLSRLGELIDEPAEPACLLHGDLWGGNYLCDAEGQPVLIDPAAYYGRREAELAMTTLFGGFDSAFYGAYEEAWPLAPGSAERLEIYKLYHLLNHLNLFGGGYLGGCLGVLRRFA